jgi:Tol biopolymer transport system component
MTGRRRTRQVLAAAIVSCGMLVPAAASAAGPDTTMLVSGNANGAAEPIAVSDRGRHVLFSSEGSGLDPAADGSARELFVHDRVTGTTRLASRGDGRFGAQAASGADEGDISADGRYVVFSSADRLAPDAPSGDHVYLRDVATGATTLVDRGPDGSPADDDSTSPLISDDGSRVLFLSDAPNLGVTGENPLPWLFVRDLRSGETKVAAVDASGRPAEGLEPDMLDFSGDGRHVAFSQTTLELPHDGEILITAELNVRDLDTGTTTLVSRTSGPGGPGEYLPMWPTISRDGSRVAYTGWEFDLNSGGPLASLAYVSDVGSTTAEVVAANVVGGVPAVKISPDGRRVAFESADTSLVPDAAITTTAVFMRDMTSGAVTLLSRASGAAGDPADADANVGTFATDGSAFAFRSAAGNLVPGAAGEQAYLRLIDGDPPRNLTAPAIAGRRELLTCLPGTWAEEVSTFSYQWLRNDAVVSGATDSSYVPAAGDLDVPLACRVTAANRGGKATAESGPAIVLSGGQGGVVAPPVGQPTPVGPPGPAGKPAQPSATRLAVALAPGRLHVKRNHVVTITYLATARAKLTLTAARGHAKARVLARKTAPKAGRGTVRVRVRLRPGTYRLAVRAQAGARHASDTIRLTVTR